VSTVERRNRRQSAEWLPFHDAEYARPLSARTGATRRCRSVDLAAPHQGRNLVVSPDRDEVDSIDSA
jgi:hypothetical protein